MADIAELGYKVDSSGLVEGTKALDDNAAAAEKTGNAAARLEKEYQSMSRSVEQSSRALGDRLGGALDRIGIGTTSVVSELQMLNRTQGEVLTMLGGLEGRLSGAASSLQAYSAAGKDAVATEKQVATASRQLEQDIAAQEARFRSIAQQAVSYAENMRGANLSERALAEAARESTSALNSRVAVMANAGTEQERMVARANALQQAEARTAQQAKEAARAAQAQELNLKKLLGQIDPTVAALNRLAEQEDRLAKARDLGLLKPQVFQQYQAQLETTRAKTLAAAQGTGTLTGQLGQLNLQSIETQQSVVALMRALATGDIGQAQSSIASLTARTGALSGMLTATGLAVGGTVAGIAALGVVSARGYLELRKLEGAVTATGGAAGMTADQLMAVRTEIGGATGNFKDASAAISTLVSEGRASGQVLELIASSALNLSTLTGAAIGTTVTEIESLATGGADALVKLNDRYSFLTPEIYRHIEAVREQRGDYAATQAALEQFDAVMSDRAQSMAESAGIVEQAWKGALSAFRGTLEEIKSIGRNDLDSQVEQARRDLAYFQSLQGSPLPGDARRGATGVQEMQQRIVQLAQWKQEMGDGAAILGQVNQRNREVIAVERELARERSAADEALKGRLAGLDREAAKRQAVNKIIETYNKLDDNDARHFDGSMQRLINQSNSQIDKQFNRSEKTPESQGEKDAKALARAYESLNEQMAQQIALYGDKSRLSQTAYQIERGNLRGLKSDLAEVLLTQAAQLDAQERQKTASQDLAKLQADLNKQDRMGLALAQDRLKVLNEAKGEGVITGDDYNATLAKILAAGTPAPTVTGVDALYGGGAGELDKLGQQQKALEEWYAGQLLMLQTFRDSESSVNALYDQQALADRQAYVDGMNQIDRARQNVMLATAEQGFAAVTDVMKTSFSEQSALYKAAFVVQKAAAIAQATLAIQAGMAEAAKNPWPANLAAIASVAAATAGLISNIAAVGMAHEGIDSVPQDGTWLLQKGERVMTSQTSAKLDATLDRIASGGGAAGGGSSGNTYSPQIYINGDPDARTLQLVETAVRRGMTQTYDRVATEMATGQGRVAKGLRNGNTVQRRVR